MAVIVQLFIHRLERYEISVFRQAFQIAVYRSQTDGRLDGLRLLVDLLRRRVRKTRLHQIQNQFSLAGISHCASLNNNDYHYYNCKK